MAPRSRALQYQGRRVQDRAQVQLPLTGQSCVQRIITDLCVIDVEPAGLVLRELAPGVTIEEVRAATEPDLIDAL